MSQIIRELEKSFIKSEVPDFRAGDTVRVAVRIVEGDKERIQNFEGLVIARSGTGMNATFTVRRVSFGVGMERTFSLHAPRVESIKVIRQGRVRRSKLYYLRDLSGKKARIAETRRKRNAKDTVLSLLSAEKTADELRDEAPVEVNPEAVASEPHAVTDAAEGKSE